jgi:peroxin-1
MSPKVPYMKLTNNSEVIVAPKVRNTNPNGSDESTAINDLKKQQTSPHVCLRTLPINFIKQSGASMEIHVHPDSAEAIKDCVHVRVTKVIPAYAHNDKQHNPQQQLDDEKESDSSSAEKARATFANVVLDRTVPESHVFLDPTTCTTLGIKAYDIVKYVWRMGSTSIYMTIVNNLCDDIGYR